MNFTNRISAYFRGHEQTVPEEFVEFPLNVRPWTLEEAYAHFGRTVHTPNKQKPCRILGIGKTKAGELALCISHPKKPNTLECIWLSACDMRRWTLDDGSVCGVVVK